MGFNYWALSVHNVQCNNMVHRNMTRSGSRETNSCLSACDRWLQVCTVQSRQNHSLSLDRARAWACWVTLGAQQAGPCHKDPERGGSFLTACRSLIYPTDWTGYLVLRLPWSLISKETTCQLKRHGSIPGPGRSLGEGHSNSLWYSSLENPMDRGAWWATYSSWGPQRVIT